ncbi:TauD/TfdA family dioxygenase [Novosphingobium sp. PS1R-30]|uniref:TauD/TfdA family dioxygenase n=1 Tax=Novosphingobium anseongense TaxID=3133436 RepID=A0ABU8RW67_9SPHN
METKMLGPGFAVEVTGIDPREATAGAAELRALLDAYGLLVLRCPDLSADDHLAFVGLFGRIYDEARDKSGLSHVSNVFGSFPTGRLLFHQDFAFTPNPHPVQSLYAEEVEGAVAPTLFVSNVLAYEKLSPAQREGWAGLTAVHARDATRRGNVDDEFVRIRLLDLPDGDDPIRYPRAHHAVLKRHPRTAAPLLFANEYYTSHILELPPEQGEPIIQEACALLYASEAIYAHEWHAGDLVVWDNIALQHARAQVRPETRRTLRRILVNDAV